VSSPSVSFAFALVCRSSDLEVGVWAEAVVSGLCQKGEAGEAGIDESRGGWHRDSNFLVVVLEVGLEGLSGAVGVHVYPWVYAHFHFRFRFLVRMNMNANVDA